MCCFSSNTTFLNEFNVLYENSKQKKKKNMNVEYTWNLKVSENGPNDLFLLFTYAADMIWCDHIFPKHVSSCQLESIKNKSDWLLGQHEKNGETLNSRAFSHKTWKWLFLAFSQEYYTSYTYIELVNLCGLINININIGRHAVSSSLRILW